MTRYGPDVRVGELELIPLSDGTVSLPPEFYVGLDVAAHPGLVGEDGKLHMPIGCYVVRSGDRTILLDAGLGPIHATWASGGALPAALVAAEVRVEEIDLVVCTHLHLDHVGWLAQDGRPFFPNATVRYGAADWEQFVESAEPDDPTRGIMQTLARDGRLEPIDGDMVALGPGITARHTPGHTLGHYCLVLSSGTERAFLLGDAVECPLQLSEPDFYVMSDVDPGMAARTRDALWRELDGSADLVGAAHFPDLQFGRVVVGAGRRWFVS